MVGAVLKISDVNANQDQTGSERELCLLIEELRSRVNDMRFPEGIVPRTDSTFLAKFIRTKDYDVDSALLAVQKYYANVYRNLDLIGGVTPSQFKPALDSNTCQFLKHLFNGVKILVIRVRNWSPKDLDLRSLQLATVTLAEHYISNDIEIQKNGIAAVFDLAGLRFDHVKNLTVKELRRIILTIQDGIPLRVAGCHFLNPPPFFWPLYQIAMPFLKEKIRKRVQLHYSFESLHNSFSKEKLPISLGGDLSEEDATERSVVDDLLENNVPYEKYWNGNNAQEPQTHQQTRRLGRKRSRSHDFK